MQQIAQHMGVYVLNCALCSVCDYALSFGSLVCRLVRYQLPRNAVLDSFQHMQGITQPHPHGFSRFLVRAPQGDMRASTRAG